MKNNRKNICFLLAGLVLLPGCMSVPSYKPRSLQFFKNDFSYAKTSQGITLRVKEFSRGEKDYFLNGRTALLDDIKVFCISIHNLSYKSYSIAPDSITIDHIPLRDVNRLVKKTSTVSRLSGVAVSSGMVASPWLFLAYANLPVGCGGAGTILLLPFLGAAVIALPLGCAFLAQSIKSVVMNHRISKDLTEKILHKKVMIKSGGHYEGLIFVKSSDYKSEFVVKLHEKNNAKKSITFDVNLDKT